jgi:hypothetical protein
MHSAATDAFQNDVKWRRRRKTNKRRRRETAAYDDFWYTYG